MMAQDLAIASSSKPPNNNVTIIQVDKDISFVLDSRDVNYGIPLPFSKTNGIPPKTFSNKKHLSSYNPCVSYTDDSISIISSSTQRSRKPLKLNPKCTSNSQQNALKGKSGQKRAMSDTDSNRLEDSVNKKSRKTNVNMTKETSKINGNVNTAYRTSTSRMLRNDREESPDSDIEIVDIVPPVSKCIYRKEPRKRNSTQLDSAAQQSTPLYSTSVASVNEADMPPLMPSFAAMSQASVGEPSSTVQSSMKWLSANGTLNVTPVQNGRTPSAKDSAMQLADKYNLYIPEMKISPSENGTERRPKTKRELKGLYENLNEISWAHEKSFKQLLCTNIVNRHSERIIGTGKNLRKLTNQAMQKTNVNSSRQKHGLVKRNTSSFDLNRVKYGTLKPKFVVKNRPRPSGKVPFNKVVKPTKAGFKQKKIIISKANKAKIIKNSVVKPDKVKIVTKSVNKPNVKKSVIKSNVNQSVNKPSRSILKSTKTVFKVPTQQDRPKNGPIAKMASLTAQPSCSKSSADSDFYENKTGNCSYTADSNGLFSAFGNNTLKTENLSEFKNSSFVKELQNFDVSNELQVMKNIAGEEVVESAVKKGSKLRVRVEPIEHTKLWSAEFFDTFKKHVLEQAFLQTFERKDQESINTMFQELQEACFNPPNNIKPKKKKPEEEVLRCSARQSEGAFKYKEIVVKKLENYMQFVLVPNSCKRNSLTMEAMKELRDAFLLAKKDPNCRAVLLNSSGTYFCTGIDLSLLVGNNRKQAAEEMASTIRDLVLTLSTFTKPVIAAVNGTAVGFGVSLLTYCDVVLASDKATFCIPATRLGYLPEGAITLTLPQVVGSGVATEMLLYGRRLTAEQALRHGLVSEVLWPTQLMNEVIPRIETIVSQPLQVMEATKTMVRCHLWDKLKTHIDRECRLLPPLWLDAQCQHNIKRTLQTGWLVD